MATGLINQIACRYNNIFSPDINIDLPGFFFFFVAKLQLSSFTTTKTLWHPGLQKSNPEK